MPLRIMRMPAAGLYRVDRWVDLYEFPPPSQSLDDEATPINYGPRWEDFFGQFGTLKMSASASAAIGRTVARYRRRVVHGQGLVDFIKGILINEPDAGSPIAPANRIPRTYFEDAYLLHYEHMEYVEFVDLDHPATHATLEPVVGEQLRAFGLQEIPSDVTANRDRRVTRLLTSVLRNLCASIPEYQNVTGLRYSGADSHDWDAYILWQPPGIDLERDVAGIRPLTPTDPDVLIAAAALGLDPPDRS